MIEKLKGLEKAEYKIGYILTTGYDFYGGAYQRSKLSIIEEHENHYIAAQGPIYKIPKEEIIFGEKESAYEVLKLKIQNNIPISKSFKSKYPDLMEKISEEYPQYFI